MTNNIPDFFKLFIVREGRVVLGKNFSNLWLLTLVLAATFFAIAFANASLNYLNEKMNDPFINWVDIKNPTLKDPDVRGVAGLKMELSPKDSLSKYHCKSLSYGFEYSFNYFGASDSIVVYLKNRFFDLDANRDLIGAILDKDNRIEGYSKNEVQFLPANSMGVIITKKALTRLGYDSAPAYLDLACYSKGAAEYGIDEVNDRSRAPVPVLGVVNRLPGNADVVASTNLYRQRIIERVVMNMQVNRSYASSLCYFVPKADEDEFYERLQAIADEEINVPFRIDCESYEPREMFSFKNTIEEVVNNQAYHYTGFYKVCPDDEDELDPLACRRVDLRIKQAFPNVDIHRIYEYNYNLNPDMGEGHYLSIQFTDLSKLKEFVEDLVNRCGVEMEMSQINAKDNFKSVSAMAITLSVVMVLFAVVCILLFIVNLLRSYFQKIRRNIGTFKAFGMSNDELQQVYLVIVLALVAIALVISLLTVTVIQWILPAIGIMKAEGFGYLSLWNCSILSFHALITLASIFVVLASVAVTVIIVMKKLLSATPGDLIYDR